MMIKTVWSADASKFDTMVNDSIKEGFRLKVRDIRELGSAQRGFYAELEKAEEVDTEEAVAALRAVKAICEVQGSCVNCPLGPFIGECVCDTKEPEMWELPE